MGENEQGGMLRTVVVVGLVALIAGVVMMGVVGMKASMTKNTDTANYNVEKTLKPYPLENDGIVQIDKHPVTNWEDTNYNIPVYENIKPDYWREVHATIVPELDVTMKVDINSYDLDNPNGQSGNDADDAGAREINIYENGKLIQNMGWGYTTATLNAGHTYQLVVKYHNTTPRTIYDSNTKDRTGSYASHFMFGTPTGSAGKVKVTNLEAATYKMP